MVVGELAEPVDLLVIGGGPGGYTAALHAARLGREVTLVERERLGGVCVHAGCIPSKALIELAGAAGRIGALAPAGLICAGTEVDLAHFQRYKRELVAGLAASIARELERAGVTVLNGEARFSRPDRVTVVVSGDGVRYLEFRQAIVATGSRPAVLPGLEPDGERVLDSGQALALAAAPESLAVVGAGYIGLELGTAFAKLGTRVTLVEAAARVLPALDRALAAPVLRRLEALGVRVALGATVTGLADDGLVLDGGRRIEAERVLVAVGRAPNTDALGLDLAGVPVGPGGHIPVGADMRANERIAALGDVVAGPALAHKAMREAIVAAEALCGEPSIFDAAGVPEVVFSDPEIASVGLTEAQARAGGLQVEVATLPHAASGRALTLAAADGFTRLVIDRGTDRIVGVHVVGPHASELIGEGTLALEMVAAPADLAAIVHAHPTLAETLGEAARVLA